MPYVRQTGDYRQVLGLALPVVLSMLAHTSMGLIDTLFMGLVGTEAQAAVGLGATVSWALGCFFMGTLTAVNTLVAQRKGAGQDALCGPTVYDGLVVALGASLLLGLVALPLIAPVMRVVTTDRAIGDLAARYAEIRIFGTMAATFEVTFASFMRGISDTKTPMKVAFGAAALNIPLNYWLIFGGLGVPPMGAEGAALATVVALGGQGLALGALFLRPSWRERYQTGWPGRLRPAAIRQLLVVGVPIGGHWLLEMVSWTVFTVAIARFGAVALAAHNIVLQVLHLSFMPGVGISVAATTLVGESIGARDRQLGRRAARSSLMIGLSFMSLMGLGFYLGRGAIAGLFSRDPQVWALANPLFVMAAVFQVFDAMGMVSGGILRGAAMTRFPMVATFSCSVCLLLPGFYLFAIVFEGGVVGAWAGATVYVCGLGLALLLKVLRGQWLDAKPLDHLQGQREAIEASLS